MKYIVIVFIPILAVIIHILLTLDIHKGNDEFINKYRSCKYASEITPGPEDITKYDDTTLIFGAGDLLNLFEVGDPESTTPGEVYAIYHADQENYSIKKLSIENFPPGVSFHPHGLYIYKQQDGKYLYVINHAYSKGGERIEVFKILKTNEILRLQYSFSLLFPLHFNGILNDLVVLSDSQLIVTQYLPYPDDPVGRKNNGEWFNIRNLLLQIFQQQRSFAWSCKYRAEGTDVIPTCTAIQDTKAVMNNGITFDGKETVYIADPIANNVRKFILKQDSERILTLSETIQTDGGVDNVEFDYAMNKLFLGVLYKKIHHLILISQLGKEYNGLLDKSSRPGVLATAAEIDLNPKSKNYMKYVIVHKQLDIIKGCSSSYQIGNNLFFGSFADQSIAFCRDN